MSRYNDDDDDIEVECEECGERYVGGSCVNAYIREVEIEIPGDPRGEVRSVCIGCINHDRKEAEFAR